MAHQTSNLRHRELLLCLLTYKISDPLSELYFSVILFFFPLQVVSIYMIVLVTIKGNRKNTHKRYTKSEKIMLSDYFIFCNNFFFFQWDIKKRACWQFGLCQRSKVCQFLFFSVHFWWCVQIERKVPSPLTVP